MKGRQTLTPVTLTTMKVTIPLYNKIHRVASFFSKQLKFDKCQKKLGRKLSLTVEQVISLALFKQRNGIASKKAVYEICRPRCSYKTMVVNMIRFAYLAMIVSALILRLNRKRSHPIKHIDSTDIPICLFKNANNHKTMKGLASFGRSSKGIFYGLKMHMITDFSRKMLSVKFTSANADDRAVVIPLSKDMTGLFIADAGYVSQKLSREFYQEHKRILFAQPRKNMKKLITEFENRLYQTRMLIELNFRSLKMFYGLVTSLPRSADGCLANYIYSLLAYQII